MKKKIMDMDVDWERIKNEQLSFLIESDENQKGGMNPIMMAGSSNDVRETMLKALVQQAARN